MGIDVVSEDFIKKLEKYIDIFDLPPEEEARKAKMFDLMFNSEASKFIVFDKAPVGDRYQVDVLDQNKLLANWETVDMAIPASVQNIINLLYEIVELSST